MANWNTTSLSDAVKTFYEDRLLTRAQPRLVHGRWATVATFKGGNIYELRRYSALIAATNPLIEGDNPVETVAPQITIVNIQPLWYGAFMRFTEQFKMQSFDPVLSNMSGLLGEQAGLTFDTLIRTAITDGATADFAGGATARSNIDTANDKISYVDMVQNIAALESANALPVDGEDFAIVFHPHTWATLMQDSVFVTMLTREGGGAIRSGYIGRFLRSKLYVSANSRIYVDAGTSSAEVYACLFIGAESYGVAGMVGMLPDLNVDSGGPDANPLTGREIRPVEVIVKDLGVGGDDPLNLRGSAGWKGTEQEAVLNSAWIRNLEHATDFS